VIVISYGLYLKVPMSGSVRITYDMMNHQETMPGITTVQVPLLQIGSTKKSVPPQIKRGAELLSCPVVL